MNGKFVIPHASFSGGCEGAKAARKELLLTVHSQLPAESQNILISQVFLYEQDEGPVLKNSRERQ